MSQLSHISSDLSSGPAIRLPLIRFSNRNFITMSSSCEKNFFQSTFSSFFKQASDISFQAILKSSYFDQLLKLFGNGGVPRDRYLKSLGSYIADLFSLGNAQHNFQNSSNIRKTRVRIQIRAFFSPFVPQEFTAIVALQYWPLGQGQVSAHWTALESITTVVSVDWFDAPSDHEVVLGSTHTS